MQPIYDRTYEGGDGVTATLGEALNYLREGPRDVDQTYDDWTWWEARGFTGINAYGEIYRFQGDDIGDYQQRMRFIRRMAEPLLEQRFQGGNREGAARIAAFNQGLID